MGRIRTLLSRYRHGYLLLALLILIFARPFFQHTEEVGRLDILDAMFLVAMFAAVYTSAQRKTEFILFVVLAVTSMIIRVVWRLSGEPSELTVIYCVIAAVTWGYATAIVLRTVFAPTTRVTADTIYAALSGYLLIGVLWTFLYVILWIVQPDAFEFGGRQIEGPHSADLTLLGFSFTTLTTLGYGNISPKTVQADSMAMLEAITGQMYVAILVARLVGIQVAQSAADRLASDLERDESHT